MRILVRSLLCLPHFNPLMQEVHPLLVLFLQLCLEALVLDELQSVHLELVERVALRALRRVLAGALGAHWAVADG